MIYERNNIHQLSPYVPGEQPNDTAIVKLNTNENPFPPCEAVLQAIRDIDGESLRRYPSPNSASFREIAAEVHGVRPDQIIATNGGDELLRLAFTVLCDPQTAGGGVGVCEPSYSLYPVLARIHDTPFVSISRQDNMALPDDFPQRLNDAGCRLALLVNPHAPSGRMESVESLTRIAQDFKGVLLIDEAYVDFAEHDALPLVQAGSALENVILLRTLSKGYSLAGLRFGYGIGSPKLIEAFDKARDSYNVDAIAQIAAIAALSNKSEAAKTWDAVIEQREYVTDELTKRGFTVPRSSTNFVLAGVPADSGGPGDSGASETGNAEGARTLYESLKRLNVFVRYFQQDQLDDKLRITIGTRKQNENLLGAMDQIRS